MKQDIRQGDWLLLCWKTHAPGIWLQVEITPDDISPLDRMTTSEIMGCRSYRMSNDRWYNIDVEVERCRM